MAQKVGRVFVQLFFMQLSFVRRSFVAIVIVNHMLSAHKLVHAHTHPESLEVPEVLMDKA